MILKKSGFACLLTAVFSVAWAAPQATAPALHAGDVWSFRSLDGFTNETNSEFAHRVIEVNDREIVIQLRNKTSSGTTLRYYNHDLNSLDNGNIKFDPYFPDFKFPMSVGQAWNVKFASTLSSGQTSSSYASGKVVAFEKVSSPAGTFDGYKIELDIESVGSDANLTRARITTWYAPEVKRFVRREMVTFSNGRMRSKSVEELTGFKLQNDRPETTSVSAANPP